MKNLKKLLCLGLALVLLLSLAACGGSRDDDDDDDDKGKPNSGELGIGNADPKGTGSYVLEYAVVDGERYSIAELTTVGLDLGYCYIDLKADGTGKLCLMYETGDILWEGNQMWDAGDKDKEEPIEFTLKGDELGVVTEGVELIFVRGTINADKANTSTTPSVPSTTPADPSAGSYPLSYAILEGQRYTVTELAALGLDLSNSYVDLKADGTGTLSLIGETASIRWEGNRMWSALDEGDVIEFDLSGNELSVESEGVVFVFVKE